MPPAGAKRPDAGDPRRADHRARRPHGRDGVGQPEPRLPAVPAPQSRRIRRRGQGPAAHRRRRHHVPAARHHQPRLRQRRRRAGLLPDADGRLSARRRPHRHAGAGRSDLGAHRVHLQGAAHAVADAAHRRRADRHPRRRVAGARVPGRRRLQLPGDAALDSDRPALRQHRARREAGDLDRRRARRAARHQPHDERAGRQRDEPAVAARARHRRSAPGRRRLPAPVRGAGRRHHRAAGLHAGRLADRQQLRHHHAAARPRLRHQRPVRRDRRLGHRQPAHGVHVPADRHRRGSRAAPPRS